MLSAFPQLLTFSLFAPFVLRVMLGIVFLALAKGLLGKRREAKIICFNQTGFRPGRFWVPVAGVVTLVGGVLLIIGLFTQVTALVLAVVALGMIVMKSRGAQELPGPMLYYVLILVVLLSLLLTGAGLIAFDLPL